MVFAYTFAPICNVVIPEESIHLLSWSKADGGIITAEMNKNVKLGKVHLYEST